MYAKASYNKRAKKNKNSNMFGTGYYNVYTNNTGTDE
jgi:hypothetical protein